MTPKVYTHFSTLEQGTSADGVRWRTLLQFGDSWDIKGSVVMKNPGKSCFLHNNHDAITAPDLLAQLNTFDDSVQKADWYEFNADSTMKCIGELFAEYYAARGEVLNGVIQIFNLFYLREANLGKALEKSKTADLADMSDYDTSHLVAPVYLGFADLARHTQHGATAEKFFNAAQSLGTTYLNKDFNQNTFTHPLYLMRYGRNKPSCIAIRQEFCKMA